MRATNPVDVVENQQLLNNHGIWTLLNKIECDRKKRLVRDSFDLC
jgi:hypothetical protein